MTPDIFRQSLLQGNHGVLLDDTGAKQLVIFKIDIAV